MSDPRDRTREFFSIWQAYTAAPPVSSIEQHPSSETENLAQRFVRFRKQQSRLDTLVHQSSLFHDRSQEVNQLICALKAGIEQAHEHLQHLRARQDVNAGDAEKNRCAIFDDLQRQLVRAIGDLHNALGARTRTLSNDQQRRYMFEAKGAAVRRRRAPMIDLVKAASALTASEATGSESEFATLLPSQQQAQAVSIHGDDNVTQIYQEERLTATRQIEQTVSQVSALYQQLVHILAEQEDTVVRIDINMERALEHTDAGHRELLKHHAAIRGSAWLVLKVFVVVLVFVVFFVLFVA
jgi:syntaxin 5